MNLIEHSNSTVTVSSSNLSVGPYQEVRHLSFYYEDVQKNTVVFSPNQWKWKSWTFIKPNIISRIRILIKIKILVKLTASRKEFPNIKSASRSFEHIFILQTIYKHITRLWLKGNFSCFKQLLSNFYEIK